MKQLASLFLALLTVTATAQINYPFNPDENADAFISTPDLMEFLVVFGYEWEQEEIQVDSIPLSMYLSSLEAMIEASALPEGTMPGQFLQWDGESWNLVMPKDGCTLPEACNYDATAHVLDEDKCILQDECGVCDGPGAIYACGCADIPEGDCDCDGNVLDALGACGGTCAADEDGDGICDDGDACVGEADECGVCNGPGAIYGCGCSDIPEGACDCAGNVVDILGVCGGGCTADEDGDGTCDDVDECVGEYDGCGVCNGPGPVLGCGCNDIPEGYCDCNGNVLDAVGTCGGACQNDLNGDGICDDDSIPGCTYDIACNYDPSASINDGSCDFTSCYGCTDIEACNYSPAATFETGICWYAGASYDCDYNCLIDSDGDGVCDDLEVFGCTDEEACNFETGATELDDSCTYPGCNDETACNFNPEAGCDDGSCVEDGDAGCIDPNACNFDESAICGNDSCEYLDECDVCGGTGTLGCTNPLASNYDALAACDDGSCIVYGCMVDLACNYEPTANVEDESCEFGTCPGCNDPFNIAFNPTSTNDSLCYGCNDPNNIFYDPTTTYESGCFDETLGNNSLWDTVSTFWTNLSGEPYLMFYNWPAQGDSTRSATLLESFTMTQNASVLTYSVIGGDIEIPNFSLELPDDGDGIMLQYRYLGEGDWQDVPFDNLTEIPACPYVGQGCQSLYDWLNSYEEHVWTLPSGEVEFRWFQRPSFGYFDQWAVRAFGVFE